MQIINNKTLLCLLVLTFSLSSAGCNSAKVVADDNSANTHQQANVTDSNAANLAAVDTSEKKSPELTAPMVAGIYHYKTYQPKKGGNDHTLEIEDKGNGKLHVSLSGSNVWMLDSGEETMHEASGEGDAQLNGNTAIARITPDGDDRACRVNLAFTTDQVRLTTAKNCDFNIDFEGLYTKEKSNSASRSNRTKNNPNQTANLQKVSYAALSDFVNEFKTNKTGKRFIITKVPAEKISKRERLDTDDKSIKGLYRLYTDDTDSSVANMFVAPASLVNDIATNVESETSSLRVTAVIVEFVGEFDIYRSSFVTKIEGLGEDDKVIWTITGTEPAKTRFRQ